MDMLNIKTMVILMKKFILYLLSTLFSLFTVIGNSFLVCDSLAFFYKNIPLIILNVFIFFALIYLYKYLLERLFSYFDKNKDQNLKKNKFTIFFDNHPFITSFIIILLCWLPYFIAFYPCVLSPDPTFQIKQFFGIPNKYSNYVVLLDQNQIITNHHPVIHTLLLGSCLKLGHTFNNDNLGLFIYVIIQSTVFICTLAYVIKFLKDIKLGTKYRLISLFVFALVPVFPMYTMTCVKDVFFGCYIIIFISYLYKIMIKKLNIKELVFLLIIAILITISRNNGVYVIFLTLIPLLFFKYQSKLGVIVVLASSIVLFYSYDKVLLPAFKVTPTSIREALSIPFQQTARTVKYNEQIITKSDRDKIDRVLDYDTLGFRYDSGLSDPVKNGYNRYATKDDLKAYLAVWSKEFFKSPLTYYEATISNTYGYYYPLKTNWYVYYKENKKINEDGFKYHLNKTFEVPRKVLTLYAQGFPYLPGIGLIVNIGINVWLLMIMFAYLLTKKKFKEMVYLMPSIVLFLVCLASPANCYFRYALPFIFALPLNYGIFKTINKCDKIKEVK